MLSRLWVRISLEAKIVIASIGSVDSLYPSVYIYIYIHETLWECVSGQDDVLHIIMVTFRFRVMIGFLWVFCVIFILVHKRVHSGSVVECLTYNRS